MVEDLDSSNTFFEEGIMPAGTGLRISTMNYVIIYVTDMAQSVKFYRDTLGMKIRFDSPEWTEIETGTTTLALHHTEEGKLPEKGDNLPNMVFAVEDIYDVYETLKKAGVQLSSPHQVCEDAEGKKVGISSDFRDPDGNRLSVFAYVSPDKVKN